MKNNNYILTLFIFAFITLHINAQEEQIKIKGTVKYDSINLKDINIVNKTTSIGTSSDINGSFIMYAKKGDSILFSSLTYENRKIKISKTHINSQTITIYLEPDYYQLEEVMLAKKVFINWRDAMVEKGTILNTDKISNSKAPDARKLTDPNANAGGINLVSIFEKVTQKGRKRRKEIKRKQERVKQLKIDFPYKIKNLYGDVFLKKSYTFLNIKFTYS